MRRYAKNWLTNLKTASKLSVAFFVIGVLLVTVIVTAVAGIAAIRRNFEAALAVQAFKANLHDQRVEILTMLAAGSGDQEAFQTEVWRLSEENDGLLRQLAGYSRRRDPDFAARIAELEAVRRQFKEVQERDALPLIREGRFEEARAVLLEPSLVHYLRIRDLGAALSAEAQQRSNAVVRRTTWLFAGLGLLAFLAAVGPTVVLGKMIAVPLRDLTVTAEHIAAGDLGREGSFEGRGDEVGLLGQAFGRMSQSLRRTAGLAERIAAGDLRFEVQPQSERDVLGSAFATMVTQLRSLTVELTEGLGVLGAAANEISASTSQFAASAAEAASAVAQTTATVEEVRQIAQLANEKARAVSDTAQSLTATSQDGSRATEGAVLAMGRIHQQMQAIAGSMMRLSENTHAIGEIVATVEDLATQSNLLAVNAAIEAAKAGEHGKGFSVVAQEVRNLADQSRRATSQVRTILMDIQKATSAAVIVTDQGGKAVEAGLDQSSKAGEAIQNLAGGVEQAALAAVQIAASGRQQLAGVDQVAQAMESIRQVSLQNADGAKQLDHAARDLKELGDRVRNLIGQFKT